MSRKNKMFGEEKACANQPMTSAGSLSSSKSIKPVSQAENQLVYANEQLKRLSVIITDLESRLSPVLRSQDPMNDTATPEPVLTPLATEIKKIGDKLSYKADFLRNIIDRLEI